jgi:hypothetical protein
MLPVAMAAGFLAFLAVVGPGASTTVSAAPLDVCQITGPTSIGVGQKADYTAVVEDANDGTELNVDLDDRQGDSDITSINGDTVPTTDSLNDVDLTPGDNVCGTNDTDLRANTIAANVALLTPYIGAALDRGESCSAVPPSTTPIACTTNAFPAHNRTNDLNPGNPLHSWQDDDIDCGLTSVLGGPCTISNTGISAAVLALATGIADGQGCATIAAAAEAAYIANVGSGFSSTAEYIGGQIEDFLVNRITPCGAGGAPLGGNAAFDAVPGTATPDGDDGYVTIDVTCQRSGIFDLSFAVQDGGSKKIEVVCAGDVETGDIFAVPTSVEINPSVANVAHSLVWVSLTGKDGEVSFPGTKVLFTTDRCAIESSTVLDENSFEAAESLFRGINPLNPATAQAVESSTYATTGPDGASRQQEEVNTFGVTSSAASGLVQRTVAAVVLHCDPLHAPSVTPGPATITAFVERGELDDSNIANNDDLVLKTTVAVVGPPAANGVTVTAAPATVACGEKATISVDVKDSIGQPVSDHTLVEAVTNAGGVLAGTGAVAGQAGLVTPVSSTVAETFGGKATFYLLTSTANVGKYEVVVTTGGGGGVTGQLSNGGVSTNLLGGLFTTAPISVQVTVECSVPAAPGVVAPAPPSTSGPTTGQGIRPPSTGDAGLASSSSTSISWVAGAGVAAIVSVILAAVALKPRRLED